MSFIAPLGWLASGFVLLAFTMTAMIPLRISALCGNLAFIAYGQALGLKPILALHLALLPINAWRLGQEYRRTRTTKYTALAADNRSL
jgi:CRP/FNR family transcriptional regulator, cyclic AMP receptor protein